MRIYFYAFLTIAILFVGNLAGIYYHLYTSVGSYDIFMHLLGGAGLGLFADAILELHGTKRFRTRTMIITMALLAGIAWELFEAYYDIAGAPRGTYAYWIDTIKDALPQA